jgi:hypothetical protein
MQCSDWCLTNEPSYTTWRSRSLGRDTVQSGRRVLSGRYLWLAISAQGFLVFLRLQADAEMVPKLLLCASHAVLPILIRQNETSYDVKDTKNILYTHSSRIIQKTKITRPLPEATASTHHNVSNLTLPLWVGRTSGIWEPSHRMTIFLLPPHSKVSLASSMTSHFHLIFYYTAYHSLMFRKKTRLRHKEDIRSVVGRSTMLQTGTSRVRVSMRSLNFFQFT